MTLPRSPSTGGDAKRRASQRRYVSFTVGICLLTSTVALFCNINVLKDDYNPMVHRQTTLDDYSSSDIQSAVPPCDPESSTPTAVFAETHSTTPELPTAPSSKPEAVNRRELDFFIAGFPKCGTTTLVHAFMAHNETDIDKQEKCVIGASNLAPGPAHTKVLEIVQELSFDRNVKVGLKCPIGLRSHRALTRLVRHSPNIKLIIGIRHPVRFMESHYNYRITERYDKNLTDSSVPPIETLTNGNEWKGVSTQNARFEIPLMQLGKTDMTTTEIAKLGRGMAHAAVVPNNFSVFLYSLEQLKDKDEDRANQWRNQLESYLDLQHPMKPLGHENINHFVGSNAHKETIDICESKYQGLRSELVEKGKETQLWLRNKFIHSPDVTVANREHFLELLDDWGSDPCDASAATTRSS